jgi:hypothetical protein
MVWLLEADPAAADASRSGLDAQSEAVVSVITVVAAKSSAAPDVRPGIRWFVFIV